MTIKRYYHRSTDSMVKPSSSCCDQRSDGSLTPHSSSSLSLSIHFIVLLVFFCSCSHCCCAFELDLFAMSDFSRSMAAQGAHATNPSVTTDHTEHNQSQQRHRRRYPESSPHICLAFLSCCGRTDLLNHTIAAAIRHMEDDEPAYLRYEIAWVDNGSGQNRTRFIEDRYEIEHALPLEDNTGLAYGMNLLIRDLCTAPYILLLEEDWLYLDELVAPQTRRRKHAIATAIGLTEQAPKSFDLRPLLGVFLRPETYNHFMTFPFLDVLWEEITFNVRRSMPETGYIDEAGECDADDDAECHDGDEDEDDDDDIEELIHYKMVCSDPSTQSKYIWGSYTNGAGLYRRSYLLDNVGRMYGEPGDVFHDRYVESNYAYRVGLRYCHAAILMADRPEQQGDSEDDGDDGVERSSHERGYFCRDLSEPRCAAAFYHIGGGRGTRPMKAEQSKCSTDLWNFVGTPMISKVEGIMMVRAGENKNMNKNDKASSGGRRGSAPSEDGLRFMCDASELEELRDLKKQLQSSMEYQVEVERRNVAVFEKERQERDKMRSNAEIMKKSYPAAVREQVDWMEDYSDEEIWATADRMERMANSPHPLQGFWDGHGRPLV